MHVWFDNYVRLSWKVANTKLEISEIDAEIRELGGDFPIKDAVDNLRDRNCYEGWERELRYFMYRYEENLAKKSGQNFSNEQWEKIWMVSPSDSIEHIWPQSKATAKAKHRLGNLVVLPPKLNSKLRDIDPKEKADAYIKTGLLIAGEVSERITQQRKWNAQSVVERENELLNWALVEWAD